MLKLSQWLANYYLTPLGQVLESVLPAGVRGNAGTRLATVLFITEPGNNAENETDTSNTKLIESLTDKQRHVLDVLSYSSEPLTSIELQKTAHCSSAPIQSLLRLGIISRRTIRRRSTNIADQTPLPTLQGHILNREQQNALDKITNAINARRHETFLLHGVTGSGKTEVYIRAIDEVVRDGRQAIVLVPEISLTPQTVSRFRDRFGKVAVLHSHLSDAQRHHEWTRIVSGDVNVVVGARSAIFAPVPNLGLIVIDEEHEGSFKQETAPRYHARTVARVRAGDEKVPLILGSATPSLESWYHAQRGKYTLLSMPRRVRNLVLPYVDTVDLRNEIGTKMSSGAIHRKLHESIKAAIGNGGQVILLLNRRGFNTQIQCQSCGEVVYCPDCNVALTHHREREIALCHYCDYQIPSPDRCPKCGMPGMRYSGFGTQRHGCDHGHELNEDSCSNDRQEMDEN
jgi:primosomal protein N' (replication factor Y)